jgi:2-oxoglutarate dehydrogenase E2 component (dihydrolipoamide succinyltransferase)
MGYVVMPQFGETVAEGELTRWLVSVGDLVEVDQPIAEISTDKVDAEVVASEAGPVTALLVAIGDVVAVGSPLIAVGEVGDTASPAAAGDRASAATPTPQPAAPPRGGSRPRTTPKARRLARELGVTLSDLGAGPIRAADVLAAARPVAPAAASPASPTPAPAPSPTPAAPVESAQYLVQHSRVRRITAQRTRDSLSTAATAWSVTEVDYAQVDMSRRALSAAWKARFGSSLTYLPYVLRAAALGLMECPHLNAQYREDGLVVSEDVHLGIAVDLGAGGLVVPVIRDAQSRSVAELAVALQTLAGAARSGTLSPDSMAGATFAVTNNGSAGSVLTMPIINQPNVGILSFDAVVSQPAVVTLPDGGQGIGIRPRGALALSWDHRAIDGAYAARFLSHVKNTLETTAWDVSLPD